MPCVVFLTSALNLEHPENAGTGSGEEACSAPRDEAKRAPDIQGRTGWTASRPASARPAFVFSRRLGRRRVLPPEQDIRRISEQTIYTWRKRFGTFQTNDVRRLKQLEAENARLKKLVAERDLEIEVMKELTSKKW
jgi:hypothetical protein